LLVLFYAFATPEREMTPSSSRRGRALESLLGKKGSAILVGFFMVGVSGYFISKSFQRREQN
jgi:hypothetical protein